MHMAMQSMARQAICMKKEERKCKTRDKRHIARQNRARHDKAGHTHSKERQSMHMARKSNGRKGQTCKW